MKRIKYLIPSLLAAGFGSQDTAHATVPIVTGHGGDPDGPRSLFELFKQGHMVTLAQHRSHSSHSSHGSHRSGSGGHRSHSSHTSHRSSAGGYAPSYSPPAEVRPAPTPTPQSSPTPSSSPLPLRSVQPGEATPPQINDPTTLSGRNERFKAIVRRVQIALLAQGDYTGAIDGIVGPKTRGAIRQFQERRGLDVTGTITSELLDALRVSSE